MNRFHEVPTIACVEKFFRSDREDRRWTCRTLALRQDGTIWGKHVVGLRTKPLRQRNHGWKMLRVARPEYVTDPASWVALQISHGWKHADLP